MCERLNLTKELLFKIILITFIVIAFVLFLMNSSEKDYKKDLILKEQIYSQDKSFEITDKEIITKLKNNTNENLVNNKDKLNSEYEIIKIQKENLEYLSKKYEFAFNKSILNEYNLIKPQVGDYIIEFDSLIVIFDYEKNVVKSLFSISNN